MEKIWSALRRVNKSVWIIIIVLLVIRLILPFGIKYAINWYLGNKMENYQGHIQDFDLALYRGAYQIEDLKIWKKTKSPNDPLVAIKEIDLSLAWRALFRGKILGDLDVRELRLNFVDSDEKEKQQYGAGEEDWKTVVGKLVPIELESFRLRDSSVHFINRDLKVPVDVVADKIEMHATNIKNAYKSNELLPSFLQAEARVQKNAMLRAEGRLNLISRIPAFEVKITLDKLDVTKLNSFFIGYGPFSLTSGKFSAYSEVSSKDNAIKGYVKPFFEDIDVMDPKEKYDSPKRFFNEVAIAWANMILRNGKTKTVATKVEFQGSVKDPDINKWSAFWATLRNGFIEALKKQLDNSISIKDVKKKK